MAMQIDVPVFKKCCFCIPLRHGLLVWGYLKLVAVSLLLILMLGWISTLHFIDPRHLTSTVIFIIFMLILIINFKFTITFLIGAHWKHEKLIRIYYKFGIVYLILNTISVIALVIYQIYLILSAEEIYGGFRAQLLTNIIVKDLMAYLSDIMLQGYLLILVRSELLKLRGSYNVEFVNHTATGVSDAAACNMVVTITEKK